MADSGHVLVGDIFVHGSGECDQLGLGDGQRERKKPTLVKALRDKLIYDVAVGALHVVCLAVGGALYSWGCNDDGALGRPSDGNSDCEPHPVAMPAGTHVRRIACGDNHSCALDVLGRVWLWGTYKDSNGHIGAARKRKQDVVVRSGEPSVVLEGCAAIASGANHTVALAVGGRKVFAWGSNATGQLGLATGAGCGLDEREVSMSDEMPPEGLKPAPGGGVKLDEFKVVRLRESSGAERSAVDMTVEQLRAAIGRGIAALIMEAPDREVPKAEKQDQLVPQAMHLAGVDGVVVGVFASSDCTFIVAADGSSHGCGLNGDAQVGLGFPSMAVRCLRRIRGIDGASWLGGGEHASAALVAGNVFTWGRAEDCGHGLGPETKPIMEPLVLTGLPAIRCLRSGGRHMLACSEGGDVFVWGQGLTYQLGNRPRRSADPSDAEEDPSQELRPYCLSSKQLEERFVLLADGGAQHSVELAWNGKSLELPVDRVSLGQSSGAAPNAAPKPQTTEPPSKKRAIACPSGGDEPLPMPSIRAAEDASSNPIPPATVVPAEPDGAPPVTRLLVEELGDRWKCEMCSCKWGPEVVKCGACETFRPGMSADDVARMKADEERRRQEDIAKFRSPSTSAVKPTGFGSLFGGDSAQAPAFSFGAPQGAPPGGVIFGFSKGPLGHGAEPPSTAQQGAATGSGVSFGFGSPAVAGATSGGTSSSLSSTVIASVFGATYQLKQLARHPSMADSGHVLVGDIFVHGSGECDQLGLGDGQRERKKPTLVKALRDKLIYDVAVGALHVVCLAVGGALYSWGCNDDGALGRPSDGNSDCEPHPVAMPAGTHVRRIACGDNHSCALDVLGRVWLWGTYKDSNGHIGAARKRKQDVVVRSGEPSVVLEGCAAIASGANHTVALAVGGRKVFAWGSNATGQLGLATGAGCGLDEREVSMSDEMPPEGLKPAPGGGVKLDEFKVVRLRESSGAERSAVDMTVEQLRAAIGRGIAALIMEAPDREVPKAEKQDQLVPQAMHLAGVDGVVVGVFASSDCTFIVAADGSSHGCGLNGDAQVGLGFPSMAVRCLRRIRGIDGASWLGGGEHASAALVAGNVFTWGRAEDCGHGLGPETKPIMEPLVLTGLPAIRCLRSGGRHMLACSEGGDVFVWGQGLTYQLGNRPRRSADPSDAEEDPSQELRPYCLSSKQLEERFVLLADGGAQHSVELAWNGKSLELPVDRVSLGQSSGAAPNAAPKPQTTEPPSKKRAIACPSGGDEPLPMPSIRAAEDASSNPIPPATVVPAEPDGAPPVTRLLVEELGDRWKCEMCSCKWGPEVVKCGACETFRPGMSADDVARMKADEERRRQEDIAKFRSPSTSAVKPTGFGSLFGGDSAQAPAFSFGAPQGAPPGGVIFGFSKGPLGHGAEPPSTAQQGAATGSGVSFGFGSPAVAGATSGDSGDFGGSVGSSFIDSASLFGAIVSSPPPVGLADGKAPARVDFGFGTCGASAHASGGGAQPALVWGFGTRGIAPASGARDLPLFFGFGGGSGAPATGCSSPQASTPNFGTGPETQPASSFGFIGDVASAREGAEAFVQEHALLGSPDFGSPQRLPVGDVLVHGSGERDQLGLGEKQRERKKPTVIKALAGKHVCGLAVGGLHVVCICADGGLYSWGCNDDGALGRASHGDLGCIPDRVPLPVGTLMRKVSCGDNHTCALDSLGRVWLWGTYKDTNGHIGIAGKRKQQAVDQKRAEPAVVLEGCTQIASGANHTVALSQDSLPKVFAWGSNATGQLGLRGAPGCGLHEREIPSEDITPEAIQAASGGKGAEVNGLRVVRLRDSAGQDVGVRQLGADAIRKELAAGFMSLIVEMPDREVSKEEKQRLLFPQEMFTDHLRGQVMGIFASSECTFVTVSDCNSPVGCGLNGDGQVGLGFASMAVQMLRPLRGVPPSTEWLGGGLHFSAALVGGAVYTWGRSQSCGRGPFGEDSAHILFEPGLVQRLPPVRLLRCADHHTLACTEKGHVYAWGCGLNYRLGNRPRDFVRPTDVDEEPQDELRPYCISSKELESRFVLEADGGAQHSVVLAWHGEYAVRVEGPVPMPGASHPEAEVNSPTLDVGQPPAKRRTTAITRDSVVSEAAWNVEASNLSVPFEERVVSMKAPRIAAAVAAEAAGRRRISRAEVVVREEARLVAKAESEVLRYFTGALLSNVFDPPKEDASFGVGGVSARSGGLAFAAGDRSVIWSPRRRGGQPLSGALTGTPFGQDGCKGKTVQLGRSPERLAADLRIRLAKLERSQLEALVLEAAHGVHNAEGALAAAVRRRSRGSDAKEGRSSSPPKAPNLCASNTDQSQEGSTI